MFPTNAKTLVIQSGDDGTVILNNVAIYSARLEPAAGSAFDDQSIYLSCNRNTAETRISAPFVINDPDSSGWYSPQPEQLFNNYWCSYVTIQNPVNYQYSLKIIYTEAPTGTTTPLGGVVQVSDPNVALGLAILITLGCLALVGFVFNRTFKSKSYKMT